MLVVEDETDLRESLIEILELKGHTAFGVSSMADYFVQQAQQDFDLAVVDRQLGDGDGLEVLRHIRQTRSVPAVLITGSQQLKSDDPETATVADLCIAKPFAVQPLLAFIGRLVDA